MLLVMNKFIRNYSRVSDSYKAKQRCVHYLNTRKGSAGIVNKL